VPGSKAIPPKEGQKVPEPTFGQRVKALWRLFGREDKVLVVITADPDSLASAVAFRRLLWRRVSHVTVASTNQIRRPDNLHLVKALKLKLPLLEEVDPAGFDKLVMVDSQPHHCPRTAALKFHAIVDHHPFGLSQPVSAAHPLGTERAPRGGEGAATGPEFADIRPDFGATATIFVNYLKAAKIRPNQTLATALFYAIKTDTQNFVRQGQLEDMVAFRWLYPLINHSLLTAIEKAPIDKGSFGIILSALSQASFRKNYAYAFVEKLDHADTLVLAADFLMQVSGVERAAVSGVSEDKLVVVLRSAGLRANLGSLAKTAFGAYGSAGGHKNMARAEIDLASLERKLGGKQKSLSRFVLNRLTEALSRKPRPKRPEPEKAKDPEKA
jgi:nanoRNase/pAp phosphatase (c-di-AMP/oligoRNAs hydrolase)